MRVEYEICSTICGTPVQAISDNKDLTELGGQGRSKSAQEWPEFGFGAVQRSPHWSMTPEMDPKCFPQLPVIDSSPFPDLLKHYSRYKLKQAQILVQVDALEILCNTL